MGLVEFVILAAVMAATTIVFLAFLRPDRFRIERTILINAAPERIFAEINDFCRWDNWSPWASKDPAMTKILGAITAGRGATYAWDGNGKVGKGRMQIIESQPFSKVAIALDFEKPFKASNVAEFILSPTDHGTEISWAMSGPANLISRIMDVLMNMDRMVGRDFEAGLATLKSRCEA